MSKLSGKVRCKTTAERPTKMKCPTIQSGFCNVFLDSCAPVMPRGYIAANLPPCQSFLSSHLASLLRGPRSSKPSMALARSTMAREERPSVAQFESNATAPQPTNHSRPGRMQAVVAPSRPGGSSRPRQSFRLPKKKPIVPDRRLENAC